MYRPSGRRAAEIAADVEAAIAAGRAPAGTVLPPVRSLAAHLGIAAGTVAAAYRLLADRGVVEGHARAGTVIRARPGGAVRRAPMVPPGTRDLATGNPDPTDIPRPAAILADLAIEADRRGDERVLYGTPPVLPELGEWARLTFAADGIPVDAVTVTGGAMDAVERALAVHLRPGMRVAVEDPAYAGMLDLLLAMGLTPEPVALDDDGMLPDALAEAIRNGVQAVVVTPRAQNPTGAALTETRAAELAGLLGRAPDLLVIEDDHAGPVSGAPAYTVLRRRRRGMVVRSASKAFGPDLRVAVVGGDEQTIAAIEDRQSVGAGWVSHLLQAMVVNILERVTDEVTEAAADYAVRREALVAALAARGVVAHGRSGLNVWIPVAEEAPVVAGMAARGWAIAGGARYRMASPPAVRVTISGLWLDEIEAVATDLAECVAATGTTRAG